MYERNVALGKILGFAIYDEPFVNPQTAENQFLQNRIFYMGAMLIFKAGSLTN